MWTWVPQSRCGLLHVGWVGLSGLQVVFVFFLAGPDSPVEHLIDIDREIEEI